VINTNYLEKKVLIDCLEFLGRGQSPSYIDEESEILAINQKCVRNSTVDVSYARAHSSRVIVKDNAILKNGDICINSTGTGTIGRIGLWSSENQSFDNQYFADSHVTIARPDRTKVNPKYLAALLESEKIQTGLETYCFSGSTNQIELNKAALSELTIEIIPVDAQHIVANILSTIDLAITQTEAIIAKQQRIKTGLMQDLLTKGIDENGNIRSEATHEFKESAIGRIPVDWEVKKIAEAGDVKLGRQTAPRYKLGINSRPYLRVVNISEDHLDLSDIKSMDFTPDEFKKYSLQPGDVLLTEGDLVSSMNVGRSAIFRGEIQEGCCFQNSLIRFRPSEEKTAEYFHFAFCYLRSVGYFANATMATTVFHLSAGRLKKLYVPVPKTTEQVCISKILAQQNKNIDTELLKREKLLLLKTGLMQDLLTGKVRVTPLLEQEPASP
jgi:type I restriction enzyme, S subunit